MMVERRRVYVRDAAFEKFKACIIKMVARKLLMPTCCYTIGEHNEWYN